jgi:hypothetical protein
MDAALGRSARERRKVTPRSSRSRTQRGGAVDVDRRRRARDGYQSMKRAPAVMRNSLSTWPRNTAIR